MSKREGDSKSGVFAKRQKSTSVLKVSIDSYFICCQMRNSRRMPPFAWSRMTTVVYSPWHVIISIQVSRGRV
jgi:hypothetical protein